jgi:tetratricopeptide (TPR) repeat protein
MSRARSRRTKQKATTSPANPRDGRRLAYPSLARPWLLVALLVAAFVAFSSALNAPFQFDDVPSIPMNRTIERLSPAIFAPPSGGLAVSGRPIVNASFAINHAIDTQLGIDSHPDSNGPRRTFSYHLVNLLLHLGCGLLLLGILRRTIYYGRGLADWRDGADTIALVVIALWLLHPIQTDAVDYIVQRTELLVSLFYAATLYTAIRAWDALTQRRRVGWYVLSVACCLLGMGSKEVMVSAPLMVILYDRAFRTASWKEIISRRAGRVWFYAALVATAAWLALLVAAGARSTTVGSNAALTWYAYLYTQAWAIARYLWLLIWPSSLIYDYGQEAITGLAGLPGVILLVAFFGATIVAWTRERWHWFGFAGAWFFLLLGPSSSIVPIRTEIAAERRVYLASAAIILLVVVVTFAMLRRTARANLERSLRWSKAATFVFVAIALLLGAVTFRRGALYRDPEALWRDTIAKRPANPRAYDNLAAVVLEQDSTRRPEAERLLRQAIAIDSMYLPAWNNLAEIELEMGRPREAQALLERVLRIEPGFVDANARLGGVLVKAGESARAIPILERVVAAQPTDEQLVTLAIAYTATGRADDAANALRKAVALNPGRTDAAAYLGVQLAESGRPGEAIPYLETASRAPGALPLIYSLLSLSYAQVGDPSRAISAANHVAQSAQNDEGVYLNLGRAMLVLARVEDAAHFFEEAVRVAPNDPEAITRLGIAKAAGGDAIGAERLFRRALVVAPGYAAAEGALAKLRSSR